MTAKEQKIKEAYGEHWGMVKQDVDENGWFNCGFCTNGADDAQEIVEGVLALPFDYGDYNCSNEYGEGWMYWRPKSLSGIEDNNGWTRTDESMPDAEGWCICFSLENNIVRDRYWRNNDIVPEIWAEEGITHWRPKTEYPLPIY